MKQDTLASEKQEKKSQPKSKKEKIVNVGKNEELEAKINDLTDKLNESDEKVRVLAKAVGVLNNEFTKLLDAMKGSQVAPQANPSPQAGQTDTSPSPSQGQGQATMPAGAQAGAGKQDRLLQWAGLLAQLAGGGGGKEGGASDMLRLVLELQDHAEDRALNRQKTAVDSMVAMSKILKGMFSAAPPEAKPAKPEPKSKPLHLGEVIEE